MKKSNDPTSHAFNKKIKSIFEINKVISKVKKMIPIVVFSYSVPQI